MQGLKLWIDSLKVEHRRASPSLHGLASFTFGLWILLSLCTPSLRHGYFAWWPLWRLGDLQGKPVEVGLLYLLPILAGALWLAARRGDQGLLRVGQSRLALPLLLLTLLAVASVASAPGQSGFLQLAGFALAWFVYLFAREERVSASALAGILLVQGSVALGQFLLQRHVGLTVMGELVLNPNQNGISVLSARGQPWLRAYGLTVHPNLLGALLAGVILLLLPVYRRAWQQRRRWRQVGLTAVMLVGSAGLLVSFSRAAWLGLMAGAVMFGLAEIKNRRATPGRRGRYWLLLLLPAIFFLAFYYDLVLSRMVTLDSPLEMQSIQQRLGDAQLALQVGAQRPWRGVGLGNYLDVAKLVNPAAARVHNVPLLVLAEVGLPGLAAWLWLALAPFAAAVRTRLDAQRLAPWLAMLVVSQFDLTLWLGGNWQTAILFGLLAAHLDQKPGNGGQDEQT